MLAKQSAPRAKEAKEQYNFMNPQGNKVESPKKEQSFDISNVKSGNVSFEPLKPQYEEPAYMKDSLPANVAKNYISAVSAFGNSGTGGLLPAMLQQRQPEQLEQMRKVQAEKPIAATIGNIAGYAVPGSLLERGAVKALPSIFGGLGKATSLAAGGIAAGAGTGTMGAITEGMEKKKGVLETLKDIPTRAYDEAVMGGVGGGLFGLGGNLIKNIAARGKLNKAIDAYQPQPLNVPDTMLTPQQAAAYEATLPKFVEPTISRPPVRPPEPLQLTAAPKPLLLGEGKFQMPPARPTTKSGNPISLQTKKGIEYKSQLEQSKAPDIIQPSFKKETPFKAFPGELATTPPKVQPQFAKEVFGTPKQTKPLPQNKASKATKVESNIQTPAKKIEPLNGKINANKVEYSSTLTPEVPKVMPKVEPVKAKRLPEVNKMSDAEFDSYYGLDQKPSKESIKRMVDDIGAKVIRDKGTSDIPSIVNKYKQKYGIDKDIKVNYSLKKDTSLGGTQPIRDANGNITGYNVSINPNQSIEGRIGSLRHEIEHIIDLESGYATPSAKYKFNPKTDTTGRLLYENASKGHHKNRTWFERDYLRKLTREELGSTAGSVEAKLGKSEPQLPKPKTEPTAQQEFKVFDTVEDIAKERERGFSKNVKSDLNMSDDIRKSFNDSPETYDVLSNKKTLAKAQAEFDKGYDVALANFEARKIYSPEDVPLSRMLANEAAKRGDISTAKRVLSVMAEKLTDAGQLSNAARILRRSDPSVVVDFLQRRVAKLNNEGKKLYGDKWKNLELTDAQTKEIYKLDIYDEAAFEKQLNKVHDEWAKDIPATAMEKFNSWRRMAMLLNPKTHLRNIIGNSIMVVARKTADTMGAGLERAFVEKAARTKSFNWSKNKDLVDIVDADWQKNKELLAKGGRWDMDTAIFGNEKKIFDNKVLEWVNKLSRETLNWEDIIFMKRAYKDALGQFMDSRGIRQVTGEAREYAQRRAYEATYRQANKFSEWATSVKKKGGIAGTIIEARIPFVKTPANIAVNAAQYSPLGLTKLLFAKNRQNASDVIETISKGVTGTGLFSMGIVLAAMGWAKVNRSASGALESIRQDLAEQPFSIDTPKGSYTFDWAQPPSIPLAMGISVYESLAKKKTNPEETGFGESVMDAVIAGGDTFMGSTMLRSIKDIFGGKYGSFTEALISTPGEYVEQAVPSFVGQIARSIDPSKRETGGNLLKSIQSKTPFASKLLPAKVDVYGREQKQPGWFQQFFSPGTYKENSNDPVSVELVRLNNATGKTNFLPQPAPKQLSYQLQQKGESQRLPLKPEQQEAYSKQLGQAYKSKLDEFINSSEYKNLKTDKDKASKIDSVLNKVKDKVDNDFLKQQGIKEYEAPKKPGRPTLPKRASK
jgi:hypothetical protein